MGRGERQREDVRASGDGGESYPGLRLGGQTRGITTADLIEAAGGDLNAYMHAELDRTVAREVEDRVAQDVH